MSQDHEIVSAAIYPGIGIARMGNSPEGFFIGPEVPYPGPPPEGGYRDNSGALKRQAARFHVYGLNADGEIVKEITDDDATIKWTVEVANKKAAWYNFNTAMDIPQAVPVTRRNANFTGAERKQLEITPPPCSIQGCHKHGSDYRLVGQFIGQDVYLGELRTDEKGRLLFLGGHGKSDSPFPNNKPYTFGNNDGWHDDTADGPVSATVHLKGRSEPLEALGAWVATTPPNYAPDLLSIVTMYDIQHSAFIGYWFDQKEKPSFTEDIYPVLERFVTSEWVNKGFFVKFGWNAPNEFTRESLLKRLAQGDREGEDPDTEDAKARRNEFRELRRQIFNQFRYPTLINGKMKYWTAPDNRPLSGGVSVTDWPGIYGDVIATSDVSNNAYLPLPQLMYQYFYQWSQGDFIDDWPGHPPERPTCIDEVPLERRGDTLTRAAMEFCLGLAFHPGCELTWPMRNYTMYSEPFRIRRRFKDDPEPDYGDILTPAQVYNGSSSTAGGPLYANAPGDLTRWMAVPWQTDTASCRSGYAPEYDPYLPTFWPQRVPNQVLTEASYEEIINPDTSREQKIAAFNHRAVWYRFLGPETDYLGQIDTMVHRFGDLGTVEKRPGPGVDYLPGEMYVESGVQFDQEGVPDDQGKVMIWRDKVEGGS